MKNKSTRIDKYLRMVADCEARESRLTEWEVGFIDSINAVLGYEQSLSPKQIETLNKIWEHATERG